MISFDQVLLLEEKVESAVKKIEQLNAENVALQAKVVELSNALNAKSEQFSSFESNQSKIEEGILKALSRLNAVENVVLQASAVQSPSNSATQTQGAVVLASGAEPAVENTENQTTQDASPVPQPSESEVVSSGEYAIERNAPVQAEVEPKTENPPVSEPVFSEHNEEAFIPRSEQDLPPHNEALASDSLTPDIDFEFGDSDANAAETPPLTENENQSGQDSEPSQPLFDIF